MEGGVKSVTTQQQAFKAYYASLTEAELLKIAANKRSFLDVAGGTRQRTSWPKPGAVRAVPVR
jgi:hypothetical protein